MTNEGIHAATNGTEFQMSNALQESKSIGFLDRDSATKDFVAGGLGTLAGMGVGKAVGNRIASELGQNTVGETIDNVRFGMRSPLRAPRPLTEAEADVYEAVTVIGQRLGDQTASGVTRITRPTIDDLERRYMQWGWATP
jgi:hypothetical protein